MMPTQTAWQRMQQNLKRRQTQLQALLEFERNWPKRGEAERLPELIRQKRQMLDNLDSLMRDAAIADAQLEAQRAQWPESGRREIAVALDGLKRQLALILELHHQNLARLQEEQAGTAQELQEVRKQLDVVQGLRRTRRVPVRVDLVG